MQDKFWFKTKQYGWGWYPATWQGWAVLAMYIFTLFSIVTFVDNHAHSASDALMGFFPSAYILTVFLIIICYATGQKPRWQWGSEYYDVLDEKGAPTGKRATYTAVHTEGLWHRSVELYVVNSKNEVLLQKRSDKVELMPNMWDASAAGHVKSGETALQTVIAEAHEELGLVISEHELTHAASAQAREVMYNGRIRNNEFKECFVMFKDLALEDLKPEKKEVSEVKWIPLSEFKEAIVNHHPEYVFDPVILKLFTYLDTHGARKG